MAIVVGIEKGPSPWWDGGQELHYLEDYACVLVAGTGPMTMQERGVSWGAWGHGFQRGHSGCGGSVHPSGLFPGNSQEPSKESGTE